MRFRDVFPILAVSTGCMLVSSGWLGAAERAPAGKTTGRGEANAALAWPTINRECRPGAYWWWMGSAVNPTDLSRQLESYRAAGMGGVHIIPIYGAKGYESQFIDYLSPKWMAMLRHVVQETRRLDLFVDMTLGTGWCFGGPTVTPQDACALVDIQTFTVPGDATWKHKFAGQQVQALAAFGPDGQWLNLLHAKDAYRDGTLEWRPQGGPWQVYAVTQKSARRMVKRSAPGGAGEMLNPLYGAAVRRYLDRFNTAFAQYDGPKPRAIYHDSYEYQSNWSPDLLAEFAKRRGYRLERELPALTGKESNDHAARVKADYRETVSDMLVENAAPVWIDWAHAHNMITRYQAHGSPGNLLDLYAAADIPETEMFSRDRSVFASKFASSAAHVAGRKLVASETGTWLKEHFTETLADVKDLVDLLFLAGVNHVVYHGTCYSPEEAEWPGWVFYASTEMNPRNSIWRDVPALNEYIARCQAVLQAGRSDNEVLVYWPIYDIWDDLATAAAGQNRSELLPSFTVHKRFWIEDFPIQQVSEQLWADGYGFDYVSDRQLVAATATDGRIATPGGKYRAVVVPRCKRMPAATLAGLINLAEQGAAVVFCDALPEDVPGAGDLEKRRAKFHEILARLSFADAAEGAVRTAAVGKGRVLVGPANAALSAVHVAREPMVERPGLLFIRRILNDGRYYFIANRGAQTLDGWVPLGTAAESVAILDPMTGRSGVAALRKTAQGRREVYLQLAPGQALILRTFNDRAVAGAPWQYQRAAGAAIDITGTWQVKFMQGGPELPPPFDSQKLGSWTDLGGEAAERFAGTASYTITFEAPKTAAPGWILDLGDVRQSARVRLNGADLGTVFMEPFQVPVSQLKSGKNMLDIEVTNVAANRIRDLDRRGVRWRNFYDINFVNKDYRQFDASQWPLTPSGLLGPVRLLPQKPFTQPEE